MDEKSHWKGEHEKSEGYHAHLAKREGDKADVCGELADHFSEQGDEKAASALRKLQQLHKATSSLEAERSSHHREQSRLLDSIEMTRKADGSDLVPTNVRACLPYAPNNHNVSPEIAKIIGLGDHMDSEHMDTITAVPRAGQPPINAAKPNVPLEFEHLVKTQTDDDRPY